MYILPVVGATTLFFVTALSFQHDYEWLSHHLGSRSPYHHNEAPRHDPITHEYTVNQMQLIFRHGTAYPSVADTEAIAKAIKRLQTSTNVSTLAWVQGIENRFTDDNAEALSRKGQEDMYLIGRRIAAKYPEFMSTVVTDDIVHCKARSAWSTRTLDSANMFNLGLFQGLGTIGSSGQVATHTFTMPPDKDTIIDFVSSCPRYQQLVMQPGIPRQQVVRYAREAISPIVERLSRDLGITLEPQDVLDIWQGCAFSAANHGTVDTFCSLFSEDELLDIEYMLDIEQYYAHAYGTEGISDRAACQLMQETMQDMVDAIEDEHSHHRLTLKFGYSRTIVPLQTYLRLFKDDFDINANATSEQIKRRRFRASKMDTFAHNIAFQLLTKKGTTAKYVRVLLAEKPIVMPGCSMEICPYPTFRDALLPQLDCEFQAVCSLIQ